MLLIRGMKKIEFKKSLLAKAFLFEFLKKLHFVDYNLQIVDCNLQSVMIFYLRKR